MHYEGNIILPPSEANSILLQVTVGCSHNKCTFCGTYSGESFKIKQDAIINEDIAFGAQYCKRQRRVFLCDGDALIVPMPRLLSILTAIEKELPWVIRVGAYANAKSLKMKTVEELQELRKHGLGILYMGLESGDDITLKKIKKGASSKTLIEMGCKAKYAGIKLSLTVLLGLAGRSRSCQHAEATGHALSAIDPDYIGALSLMLIPGTPLNQAYEDGVFPLLSSVEMLRELRAMIAATNLSRGLFHANHASNYLPIRARLPKEKTSTIELIDKALAGGIALRPEWARAL